MGIHVGLTLMSCIYPTLPMGGIKPSQGIGLFQSSQPVCGAWGAIIEWNGLESVEQPWLKINVTRWRIRHTVSESCRAVLTQTEDDSLEKVPRRHEVILGKAGLKAKVYTFLMGFIRKKGKELEKNM